MSVSKSPRPSLEGYSSVFGGSVTTPLIVPLVIWPETPLKHDICAVLLYAPSAIITGSRDGHICIWEIVASEEPDQTGDVRINPRLLLLGHKCAVVGLTKVGNGAFFSVSKDGSVCAWDIADGRCMASASHLLKVISPTSASELADGRHILVAGESHIAAVVSAAPGELLIRKFVILANNWVSVSPCPSMIDFEGSPITMALSEDGYVQFCALDSDGVAPSGVTADQPIVMSKSIAKSVYYDYNGMNNPGPLRKEDLLFQSVKSATATVAATILSPSVIPLPGQANASFYEPPPSASNTRLSGRFKITTTTQKSLSTADSLLSPQSAIAGVMANSSSGGLLSPPSSQDAGFFTPPPKVKGSGVLMSPTSSPVVLSPSNSSSSLVHLQTQIASSPASDSIPIDVSPLRSTMAALHPSAGQSLGKSANLSESTTAIATITTAKEILPLHICFLDLLSPPKMVANCPSNFTFAAISNDQWAVYSAANSRVICSSLLKRSTDQVAKGPIEITSPLTLPQLPSDSPVSKCPRKSWTSVDYLDSFHLLVWSSDGNCRLVRLPDIRLVSNPSNFSVGVPIIGESFVNDDSSFGLVMEFSVDCNSEKDDSQYPGLVDEEKYSTWIGSRAGDWICSCSTTGKVVLWKVPTTEELSLIPIQTEKIHLPSEIRRKPTAVSHFANAWKKGPTVDYPPPRTARVTSSFIFDEKLILVRGYSDGKISVHKLPHEVLQPRFLRGHESGAVRSIICHEISFKKSKVIISGGDDGQILVTSLKGGEILHSWYRHSGPIKQLSLLASASAHNEMAGDILVSVSADRCVGIFSLNNFSCLQFLVGHPAPIKKVCYRQDQDYLLVLCKDQSLSIWEMSTGTLEGRICGASVADILDVAIDLRDFSQSRFKKIRSRPLGSTYIQSSSETPAEILLLNVKQLVHVISTSPLRPSDSPKKSSTSSVNLSLLAAPPPYSAPSSSIRRTISPSNSSSNLSSMNSNTIEKRINNVFRLASIALTYLIPWGLSTELIDDFLGRELQLYPPTMAFSYGLRGHRGKLSFLLPSASTSQARWTTSPFFTATYLLACLAYIKSFLLVSDRKNSICQFMGYLITELPGLVLEKNKDIGTPFVDPSIGFLLNYWHDINDHFSQSVRSIVRAFLEKEKAEEQTNCWSELFISHPFHREEPTLVLGIIATQQPETAKLWPVTVSESIIEILCSALTCSNNTWKMLAMEILYKCYPKIWRPLLTKRQYLFVPLVQDLFMTLISSCSRTPIDQFPECLMARNEFDRESLSFSCLMQLAVNHGPSIVKVLNDESLVIKAGCKPEYLNRFLLYILDYVSRHNPRSFVKDLIGHVELLMKLRHSAVQLADKVIKIFKTVYNTFSERAKRLAAASGNIIVVYDLESNQRLFVLKDEHKSKIHGISLSADGRHLVSCSLADNLFSIILRQNTAFFGFSNRPKIVAKVEGPLPAKFELGDDYQALRKVSFTWMSDKSVATKIEGVGNEQFLIAP